MSGITELAFQFVADEAMFTGIILRMIEVLKKRGTIAAINAGHLGADHAFARFMLNLDGSRDEESLKNALHAVSLNAITHMEVFHAD